MGKASSAKKVARAARAGGSSRSGRRRNIGFPIAIGLVLSLGVTLVLVARSDQVASAQPVANVDHWHAAYGLYGCDAFLPPITDTTDTVGIHTHGDGVIHIHPFVSGSAGANAKLGVFLDTIGMTVSTDELAIPGGDTFKKGDDCNGTPGIIQVAYWASASDAAAGQDPTEIITSDFNNIRFRGDREAFTIAFAPAGTKLPPPESIPTLDQLSDTGNSTSSSTPGDTGSTTSSTPPDTSTSSTVAVSTTSTSQP